MIRFRRLKYNNDASINAWECTITNQPGDISQGSFNEDGGLKEWGKGKVSEITVKVLGFQIWGIDDFYCGAAFGFGFAALVSDGAGDGWVVINGMVFVDRNLTE